MDQSRAINALAPFVALAKSANSPRAAADLVTQATSAANTYVFAELLQQPNVQALAGQEKYGNHYTLLELFAWGTWEDYKSESIHSLIYAHITCDSPLSLPPDASATLPQLSDAQAQKLRLLSLLTFAAQKSDSPSAASTLSYNSLCTHLDLASSIELEQLITSALYSDLITGTLNPAAQTIVITSVAPLRDLAPGSVQSMIAELAAWSGRCDTMLVGLEAEIRKVKSDSEKRAKQEARAERQMKALMDDGDKGGSSTRTGAPLAPSRTGQNARNTKKMPDDSSEEDGDAMDVDSGPAGKKKGSVMRGLFKR